MIPISKETPICHPECEEAPATIGQALVGITLFLSPEQIKMPRLAPRKGKTNLIIRRAATFKRYGMPEPLPICARTEANIVVYEPLEGGADCDLQAAILAGLARIPCTIVENGGKNSEIERIFAQIRQKTLHIFDQAVAFRLLTEEYGLTQADIAKRLAISQSAVANKLRLLAFDAEERQKIRDAGLTERHARAILRLKDAIQRAEIITTVSQKELTVADTERLIELILSKKTEEASQVPQHCRSDEKTKGSEPRSEGLPEFYPKKFVLKSLQPLYNSIEHALAIFRKTGREATLYRKESPDGVLICINIPAKTE